VNITGVLFLCVFSSVDNGSGLMNKSSTHMFEAMAMEIEQLLAQVSVVVVGTVCHYSAVVTYLFSRHIIFQLEF